MSQEFRLKNIDKTRNYFFEEIKQNELMIRKQKVVCTTLTYTEHFLTLASAITGCFFPWYYCRNYKFCNSIKNL